MAIEEQDPTKAAEIKQWLNRVCDTFNILPMDGPTLMSSSLRRQLLRLAITPRRWPMPGRRSQDYPCSELARQS